MNLRVEKVRNSKRKQDIINIYLSSFEKVSIRDEYCRTKNIYNEINELKYAIINVTG